MMEDRKKTPVKKEQEAEINRIKEKQEKEEGLKRDCPEVADEEILDDITRYRKRCSI